jgi:hypothetical protein
MYQLRAGSELNGHITEASTKPNNFSKHTVCHRPELSNTFKTNLKRTDFTGEAIRVLLRSDAVYCCFLHL